ncbi:Phage protein [Candidatus Phaeomarinobacter ectocarpi]|uniref:Phage protein n=1 Tax=Candidatus Phaeomarinibacter ectocarpi TaxID=1458461 RepID=X5MMZ0_9HYPH|nr:3TM-type holin [Candidatus Phaeomarinobacter ectocarpi]CDO60825.1 Phage protein [Candidatus Phaeomarinobacter ectocarpi]
MDWKDIGRSVAKSAPLIGGLLGGPAGGAIGAIVASVLGTEAKPDEVAAVLRTDPDALAKVIEVEAKQQVELTRMTLEAETARFGQQHETIRAELANENIWKSGWRPFFGWSSGVVWLAMGLGIVYSIIFKPAEAPQIMEAVAAMTGLFGIALTVLGVNIHQRSQDKRRLLGQPDSGIFSTMGTLLGRGVQ